LPWKANAADELTSVSGQPAPIHDTAGNMTFGGDLHYTYDAWNRLVQVRADDSGSPGDPIATYVYDAKGRRIRKLLGPDPEDPTLALDYCHNQGGQVVEVRKDGDADPLEQFVWSARYVYAPVQRLRDANTNGDLADAGDSTLYYTVDANFNVTGLCDASAAMVERVAYDPYGRPTFYDGSWANPSAASAASVANDVLFTGQAVWNRNWTRRVRAGMMCPCAHGGRGIGGGRGYDRREDTGRPRVPGLQDEGRARGRPAGVPEAVVRAAVPGEGQHSDHADPGSRETAGGTPCAGSGDPARGGIGQAIGRAHLPETRDGQDGRRHIRHSLEPRGA
jgi:hypothetical protein